MFLLNDLPLIILSHLTSSFSK